jgi:hypothetical protein
MSTIYVIEYFALYSKEPAWRPMPNEVYLHEKEAERMKMEWVKGSPPDIEFTVEKYESAHRQPLIGSSRTV